VLWVGCAVLLLPLLAAETAPRGPQPRTTRNRARATSPAALALPEGVSPPRYRPGPIPFHDGEALVYQASWLGIPAAGARVELHRDRSDSALWTGEVWINTNRFVDVFYRMRDHVREDFHTGTFEPSKLDIRHQERERWYRYHVDFEPEAAKVTATRSTPRASKTLRFIADDPWGPLSGSVMALSQQVAEERTLTFDTFTGGARYVFRFEIAGRERIGTRLGEFDAYRVVPSVVYMSDTSSSSKVSAIVLWVSADSRRLPLRLVAATYVGSITIDLVKVEDGERSLPADRALDRGSDRSAAGPSGPESDDQGGSPSPP
jgi:hypothetical protein